MPIIKNKKRFINPRASGVTLIEVMIVLAISGVLILAAIGTFGARSGVVFNASIDTVASDLRTVASETRNGLGASGSSDTTCVATSETCQLGDKYGPNTPIPSGSAIYGEAVEFNNNHCPGAGGSTTSCMIVYKLSKPNGTGAGSNVVTPYERYVIFLPSNLKFEFTGNNPLVVYTNAGEAFSFTINNTAPAGGGGSPITTVATKFSSTLASDSTKYTSKTAPNIRIVDKSNSSMQAKLNIDMNTPINITVERDAP